MPSSTPASATRDRAVTSPPGPAGTPAPGRPTGLLRRVVGVPSGLVGLVLMLLVVAAAVFANQIAPTSPFAIDGPVLQAPSAAYPMGTDDLGRDTFSGVVHGARASLILSLAVGAIVALMGLGIGAVSGYVGGLVDDALMRATEAVQVLPRFFLAILVIALFGPGLDRVVLVLGLTSWPILARVVRAEVLSVRERDFIMSARALGATDVRIVLRHVLPNVVPVVVAFLTLSVAQALLVEASLGFIGLGDPNVMTWGLLAGNARDVIRVAWWMAVFPGLAIALAVLGLNLLGDAFSSVTGVRGAERALPKAG